ncbi:MAG TPA: hypothetical protein VL633_05270 [Bacteroidota bacterium]|nr:hypothetical protein [Bacteroidota bacterium]
MKIEIRHVTPMRLANVMALIYGCMMTVFAVIFLPFFLLIMRLSPKAGADGGASSLVMVFMLCLYPVMGLIIGWLSGLLGATVFNFIVRWTGGVLVEWDEINQWGNRVVNTPLPVSSSPGL